MCEKFLDDRINIPDKIKNMSQSEISTQIADLEKKIFSEKNKNQGLSF